MQKSSSNPNDPKNLEFTFNAGTPARTDNPHPTEEVSLSSMRKRAFSLDDIRGVAGRSPRITAGDNEARENRN